MRLRTFTAATLDDAIAQVRDELGEDAVIVSTYQSRRGRGAQVTAALDEPSDERAFTDQVVGEEALEPDDEVAQVLRFHRLEESLATRLARDARAVTRDDTVMALAGALDSRMSFAALPVADAAPIMFVGPPGGGKTVTVIKAAARAVLKGFSVHIITTDTVRSGAFEQLAALAAMMDVPLDAAETPADLAAAIQAAEHADLILIDTPGTNPFARTEVDDLSTFAKVCSAQQVLVLAAGADSADLAEAAEVFASAGASALHITRLDCARRYGGIVTAAIAGGLPLAEVSASPFIANGLSPLNPVSLARLMTETAFKVSELQRRAAS
ncbi:MAG: GTP-binding protein [Alphaproteobacteria bacterium]